MKYIKTLLHKLYFPNLYFFINRLRPARSYAQYSEDIVLENIFGKVHKFIDIGANNGVSSSNTLYFALKGAKGILFEPMKEQFWFLSRLYRNKKDLICINEGISNESKELEFVQANMLSYIIETEDKVHTKGLGSYLTGNESHVFLPVKPLSYWINRYPSYNDPDFVSIDVEGHELAVLQGIDFSKFSTKCFVVETHGKDSNGMWLLKDYNEICNFLNSNGYHVAGVSPGNSFWFHESYVDSVDFGKACKEYTGYSTVAPDEYKETYG